ncbi:hypothetical protein [Spirosoma jeollabukense]
MITRIEVKTFIEDFICPKCGKGNMRKASDAVGGGSIHRCERSIVCGHTVKLDTNVSYPRTITEYVEADPKEISFNVSGAR